MPRTHRRRPEAPDPEAGEALGTIHPVDPPIVLRQLTRTQQVPLAGIQRELGLKTRAALATVRGALDIEDHWTNLGPGR
jgi:hypothetical protein